MAKDVQQASQEHNQPAAADQAFDSNNADSVSGQRQQTPLLLPSTVINLAVHSLLMITVPFVLFFATSYGALDSVFTLTGASVPRQEVKYYIGAGLAVLGVNLVVASFIVAAFREKVPSSKKTN